MVISKLVMIAVAEFIAVILIAAIVVILAMRKKIKKLELALKNKNKQLPVIDKSVEQGSDKDVKPVNNTKKIGSYYQKELDLARHQIANLEQFRDLYFSLEASMIADNNVPKMVAGMELAISEQQQEIASLTQFLKQEKKRSSAEQEYAEELEAAIEKLEASKNKMAKQVENAKLSVRNAELLELEHNNIKKKANSLMRESDNKNIEILNYKKMIAKLKSESISGQEQSKSVVELMSKLRDKDKEIAQLKKECDTLGSQYHMLAVQSLDATKESVDYENSMVDEMLAALDESAKELMVSKNLCKELETDLDNIAEDKTAQHQALLNKANSRKIDAENEYRHISSEVEAIVGVEERAKLKKMKAEMTRKVHAVERNISEQNTIVAESLEAEIEEAGNDDFTERYKELERNVAKYKKLLNTERQKHIEFDELQQKYVDLETKYLSLLKK